MNLYSSITKLLLFVSLQMIAVSSSTTPINDFHSEVASISLPRMTRNVKSNECVDTSGRFTLVFPATGERQKRRCKWVAKKKTQYRCALPKVKKFCPLTCGECTLPTASPTTSPTPNPTSTPTLSSPPTITASPTGDYDWCADKKKRFPIYSVVWILNKKNCKWVSRKHWFRCEIAEVVANCPRLCNKCNCSNNKKSFEIEEGKNKKCAWVAKKDTQERCTTYPAAVKNCPLACGLCDQVFSSASVKVTSKASTVIANLVIPTGEQVLNALKDAMKRSAQKFVEPRTVIAKIDFYYATKKKGRENEAQLGITTETILDCPTNVNSCNTVVEQAEEAAATSTEQLALALVPAGATAEESSQYLRQLEEQIKENEVLEEIDAENMEIVGKVKTEKIATETTEKTNNPTSYPTNNPTFPATNSPSDNPKTNNPTSNPTNRKTENPTKNPTNLPTVKETGRPTKFPTKFPTKKPSSKPSSMPSTSSNPSNVPSNVPSTSSQPSAKSPTFATKGELQEAVGEYCDDPEAWVTNENFNAYGPIEDWITSNIEDMEGLFAERGNCNPNISQWDVSNVKNFYAMFYAATFFNQDISGWNTSSATSFQYMFNGATSFNQDLCSWKDSNNGYFGGDFCSGASWCGDCTFFED